MTEQQAWTRQQGESPRAFRAFSRYRDLPAHARSIAAAYQQHLDERKPQRPRRSTEQAPGTWKRWASEFRWTARAAAYDAHLDVERRRENEQANREMARRHALEAEAARFVLTLPFRVLMERLQRNDPETIRQLNSADAEKLLRLAAVFGRQLPPMQAAERLARGLHTEYQRVAAELAEEPTLADHCLGNDEREDALCEFLERITTSPTEDDLSPASESSRKCPNEFGRSDERPLTSPSEHDDE